MVSNAELNKRKREAVNVRNIRFTRTQRANRKAKVARHKNGLSGKHRHHKRNDDASKRAKREKKSLASLVKKELQSRKKVQQSFVSKKYEAAKLREDYAEKLYKKMLEAKAARLEARRARLESLRKRALEYENKYLENSGMIEWYRKNSHYFREFTGSSHVLELDFHGLRVKQAKEKLIRSIFGTWSDEDLKIDSGIGLLTIRRWLSSFCHEWRIPFDIDEWSHVCYVMRSKIAPGDEDRLFNKFRRKDNKVGHGFSSDNSGDGPGPHFEFSIAHINPTEIRNLTEVVSIFESELLSKESVTSIIRSVLIASRTWVYCSEIQEPTQYRKFETAEMNKKGYDLYYKIRKILIEDKKDETKSLFRHGLIYESLMTWVNLIKESDFTGLTPIPEAALNLAQNEFELQMIVISFSCKSTQLKLGLTFIESLSLPFAQSLYEFLKEKETVRGVGLFNEEEKGMVQMCTKKRFLLMRALVVSRKMDISGIEDSSPTPSTWELSRNRHSFVILPKSRKFSSQADVWTSSAVESDDSEAGSSTISREQNGSEKQFNEVFTLNAQGHVTEITPSFGSTESPLKRKMREHKERMGAKARLSLEERRAAKKTKQKSAMKTFVFSKYGSVKTKRICWNGKVIDPLSSVQTYIGAQEDSRDRFDFIRNDLNEDQYWTSMECKIFSEKDEDRSWRVTPFTLDKKGNPIKYVDCPGIHPHGNQCSRECVSLPYRFKRQTISPDWVSHISKMKEKKKGERVHESISSISWPDLNWFWNITDEVVHIGDQPMISVTGNTQSLGLQVQHAEIDTSENALSSVRESQSERFQQSQRPVSTQIVKAVNLEFPDSESDTEEGAEPNQSGLGHELESELDELEMPDLDEEELEMDMPNLSDDEGLTTFEKPSWMVKMEEMFAPESVEPELDATMIAIPDSDLESVSDCSEAYEDAVEPEPMSPEEQFLSDTDESFRVFKLERVLVKLDCVKVYMSSKSSNLDIISAYWKARNKAHETIVEKMKSDLKSLSGLRKCRHEWNLEQFKLAFEQERDQRNWALDSIHIPPYKSHQLELGYNWVSSGFMPNQVYDFVNHLEWQIAHLNKSKEGSNMSLSKKKKQLLNNLPKQNQLDWQEVSADSFYCLPAAISQSTGISLDQIVSEIKDVMQEFIETEGSEFVRSLGVTEENFFNFDTILKIPCIKGYSIFCYTDSEPIFRKTGDTWIVLRNKANVHFENASNSRKNIEIFEIFSRVIMELDIRHSRSREQQACAIQLIEQAEEALRFCPWKGLPKIPSRFDGSKFIPEVELDDSNFISVQMVIPAFSFESSIHDFEENEFLPQTKSVSAASGELKIYNLLRKKFNRHELREGRFVETSSNLDYKSLKQSQILKLIEHLTSVTGSGFCSQCKRLRNDSIDRAVLLSSNGDKRALSLCFHCNYLIWTLFENINKIQWVVIVPEELAFCKSIESVLELIRTEKAQHEDGSSCECTNAMLLHHLMGEGLCGSGVHSEDIYYRMRFASSNLYNVPIKLFISKKIPPNSCQLCEELPSVQEMWWAEIPEKEPVKDPLLVNTEFLKICSECYFGAAMQDHYSVFESSEQLQKSLWNRTSFNYCQECRQRYLTFVGTRSVSGLCPNCATATIGVHQTDEQEEPVQLGDINESLLMSGLDKASTAYLANAPQDQTFVKPSVKSSPEMQMRLNETQQRIQPASDEIPDLFDSSAEASHDVSSKDALKGGYSFEKENLPSPSISNDLGDLPSPPMQNAASNDVEKDPDFPMNDEELGEFLSNPDNVQAMISNWYGENVDYYENSRLKKEEKRLSISNCVAYLLRTRGFECRENTAYEISRCSLINNWNIKLYCRFDGEDQKTNHISDAPFEGFDCVVASIDISSEFGPRSKFYSDREPNSSPGTMPDDPASLGADDEFYIKDVSFETVKEVVRKVFLLPVSKELDDDTIVFEVGGFEFNLALKTAGEEYLSFKKEGQSVYESVFLQVLIFLKLIERGPRLSVKSNWPEKVFPPDSYNKQMELSVNSFLKVLSCYLEVFHPSPGSLEIFEKIMDDCHEKILNAEAAEDGFDLIDMLDLTWAKPDSRQIDLLKKAIVNSKMHTMINMTMSDDGRMELCPDTNVLIQFIKRRPPTSFPIHFVLLQPVFNEILRLENESNPDITRGLIFDFLFSNEFTLVAHPERPNSVGDDEILHLLNQNESLINLFLTADIELSRRLGGQSLVTHTQLKTFLDEDWPFVHGYSASWFSNLGSSRVVFHIDTGRYFSASLIAEHSFLKVSPLNRISNEQHVKKLHKLSKPNFKLRPIDDEKMDYEFEFEEVETSPKLFENYHKTVLEACRNMENLKFYETRGSEMLSFVDNLNPQMLISKALSKTAENFDKSSKLRNKLPDIVRVVSDSKRPDSCFPNRLDKGLEKSWNGAKLIQLCFGTLFNREHVYNDKLSELANERLEVDKKKTLVGNYDIIKMSHWEEPRHELNYFNDSCARTNFPAKFVWEASEVDLVGDSEMMRSVQRELSRPILSSNLLRDYCFLYDHLVYCLINKAVKMNAIYVEDNSFITMGFILGPGKRNRTSASKRGVRFYFVVSENAEDYAGFYPEIIKDLPGNLSRSGATKLLISRFYYINVEDALWRSKIYFNLTLPRLYSEPEQLSLIYWNLFFPGSVVKKLLSFFKYFNVISLSTYSKLPGLISKYLEVLPKRESEYLLLLRILNVVKMVILESKGETILGEAEDLNRYLELNNLYTLPRPQTTSTVHDYQLMYRDIQSNILSKGQSVCEPTVTNNFSEKKHVSTSMLYFALKKYKESLMAPDEETLWENFYRDFFSYFITNTNGTNPYNWKKEKNSLIFQEVLDKYRSESGDSDDKFFFHDFWNFCVAECERRGAFALISIKPQKDAADREIVIQEFFTKATHYPIQNFFRTFCYAWESELVTKDTYKKYEFINSMTFDSNTLFCNDDMKKWSPHDIKEKFEILIEFMFQLGLLPRTVFNTLKRSMRAVRRITLLFDERLRDKTLLWRPAEDYVGKTWEEISSMNSVPLPNEIQRKNDKTRLFTPLKMEFGWPQGIMHFISSFYHCLCTIYTEKVIQDVTGSRINKISAGAHSDDKNTGITFYSEKTKEKVLWSIVATSLSVTGSSLAQSDTKSSFTEHVVRLRFTNSLNDKRVSELVSVYNVEGVIMDSYFRQSSNLANSFNHLSPVDNHLSLISRCCSVFSLSNRIYEPEVLYAEGLNYLQRFYGKIFDESNTIGFGGRKTCPIFMIAMFGAAADNVVKLLQDPEHIKAQLEDVIVTQSQRKLSETGKRFREKAKLQFDQLRKESTALSGFIEAELKRLSTPISGVFSHIRDENLNNLFIGKNAEIYSTWSDIKKFTWSVTKEGIPDLEKNETRPMTSLIEVRKRVKTCHNLAFDENVVPNAGTLQDILKVVFEFRSFKSNSSSDISGTLKRNPVRTAVNLSHDFELAQEVVERGQSASKNLKLIFSWNSLIDDIEVFCNFFNVLTVREFKSLNSVWDRLRRMGSDRNPVLLLFKDMHNFTDCKIEADKTSYESVVNSIEDGQRFQFVSKFIRAKQSSLQLVKNFNDRVDLLINSIILDCLENAKPVIDVSYTQYYKKLSRDYEDLVDEIEAETSQSKAVLSLLTKRPMRRQEGDLILTGTSNDDYYWIHEIVGHKVRIVETEDEIIAPQSIDNSTRRLIWRRFKKKIVHDQTIVDKLETDWADFISRPGTVRSLQVRITDRGDFELHCNLATSRISSDVLNLPLRFRMTFKSKWPYEAEKRMNKIAVMERSRNHSRVSECISDPPKNLSSDLIGQGFKNRLNQVVTSLGSLLGYLYPELNVSVCNYSGLSSGTYAHSKCRVNLGDVVFCLDSINLNKVGKARMKTKLKEFQSKFEGDFKPLSSEALLFRSINQLSRACHMMAGLGSFGYQDYLNALMRRIPESDLNWVRNLARGGGVIIYDEKWKRPFGFSFKVLKLLAGKFPLRELLQKGILDRILHATHKSTYSTPSGFNATVRLTQGIKNFLSSNPKIETEGFLIYCSNMIDKEHESYKLYSKAQSELSKRDKSQIYNWYKLGKLLISRGTQTLVRNLEIDASQSADVNVKRKLRDRIIDLLVNDYFSNIEYQTQAYSQSIRWSTLTEDEYEKSKVLFIIDRDNDLMFFRKSSQPCNFDISPFNITENLNFVPVEFDEQPTFASLQDALNIITHERFEEIHRLYAESFGTTEMSDSLANAVLREVTTERNVQFSTEENSDLLNSLRVDQFTLEEVIKIVVKNVKLNVLEEMNDPVRVITKEEDLPENLKNLPFEIELATNSVTEEMIVSYQNWVDELDLDLEDSFKWTIDCVNLRHDLSKEHRLRAVNSLISSIKSVNEIELGIGSADMSTGLRRASLKGFKTASNASGLANQGTVSAFISHRNEREIQNIINSYKLLATAYDKLDDEMKRCTNTLKSVIERNNFLLQKSLRDFYSSKYETSKIEGAIRDYLSSEPDSRVYLRAQTWLSCLQNSQIRNLEERIPVILVN